jgi:RNA polymerase sigma-70 factor (ECF subfamily)
MTPALDRAVLEDAAEAACRAGLRAGLREPDARDLAQEALVRALSSARPPDGVPLAAWTYGIARNLGRDQAKAARSREILVDAVPDAAVDHELTTILAVRRALDALPAPLRDVVTLHELEEHSLRETAAALAIPFDTAKDRLRRAREQLRDQLGDPDLACRRERSHSRRRGAPPRRGGVVGRVFIKK